MPAGWHLRAPERLDDEEFADRRVGRDAGLSAPRVDDRRADRGPPTHRASISFVPTTSPIRSCGTRHDQLSVGRPPWQTNPLVRLNYSAAGSPSSPNPRAAWSRSNLARAAGALDCPGGAQDADPGVVRARAEPEVRIHLPPAGSPLLNRLLSPKPPLRRAACRRFEPDHDSRKLIAIPVDLKPRHRDSDMAHIAADSTWLSWL